MSYTGYCEKQKRNYSVDFEKKPAKTLEDISAYDLGRFLCDYAKALVRYFIGKRLPVRWRTFILENSPKG